MNPRTTGILLAVATALAAFVYFYEIEGEEGRQDAEQAGKRIFQGFEAEGVTSISLRTSDDREARLERGEGGWRVASPIAFPADELSADGMAQSLATLVSDAAFDDPAPLAEYELDDASARIVRFRVGESDHELRIGRQTPVGANRYVAVAGHVYTIPNYKAASFDKALDDLRNKQVLDFDRDAVLRVEAVWPGGRVVLERPEAPEAEAGDEGRVWRITSPLEGRADQDAVSDLLSDLAFLRATGFVDEVPAAAGFDAPQFAVSLSGPAAGEGGEPLRVSFAIGAAYEGGGLLVRGGGPALYTLPSDRLADFPRALFGYRHKDLASFAVSDVEQVELFFQDPEGDPVSIVVERDAGSWRSSPETMDPDRVLPMVSELSRLQAHALLAESVGEAELAGLELSPANAVITVLGTPEASEGDDEASASPKLAELRLGRIDGSDGIVVQAAGDAAVYRLSLGVADSIPVSLEAFRNRFAIEAEAVEDLPGADGQDADTPSAREESP